MYKSLLFLLLFLSSLSFAGNPAYEKAHATAHKIELRSMLGRGGSCSANSIGPHALMTASHCNAVATKLDVDGKSVEIVTIISDGLDHSIYLLGNEAPFKSYANVDLSNSLSQGDDIFVFGNPGNLEDVLHKGYVSHFDKEDADDDGPSLKDIFDILQGAKPKQKEAPKPKKHLVVFYDFNGFFGDSGSGIFDANGNIVGVTSFIYAEAVPPFYTMKFMGSYAFRFTPEQLEQARSFVPKKK